MVKKSSGVSYKHEFTKLYTAWWGKKPANCKIVEFNREFQKTDSESSHEAFAMMTQVYFDSANTPQCVLPSLTLLPQREHGLWSQSDVSSDQHSNLAGLSSVPFLHLKTGKYPPPQRIEKPE